MAFIVQTTERGSVPNATINTLEKRDSRVEEWVPDATQRCDHADCPSQGYVNITGVSGNLIFCGHHFEKIMRVAEAKVKAFAFDIQDKRSLLIENRLKGDD